MFKNIPRDNSQPTLSGITLSPLPSPLVGKTFTDQYKKEAYTKALEYDQKIIAGSENYEDYNTAGFWWKSLGDYTKENQYYNRAAEIYMVAGKKFEHLAVYQPYVNAANIFISLGEYSRAEEALRSGIYVAREVAELYIKLADLYESHMKKGSEDVIAIYEDGLSQESYQPHELYPAYGAYLRRVGKKEAALKAFEAATQYVRTGFIEQSIKELKSELGVK